MLVTDLRVLLVGYGGVKKAFLCAAAQLPNQMHPSSPNEAGKKDGSYFFIFEPLVFGIQINRCSGTGAEEYLSLRAPVSYVM